MRNQRTALRVGNFGRDLISGGAMDWDDYLRQQAVMYLQIAENTENAVSKQELLELAAVCEEVANNVEDHRSGG
jgi:hypothetical protein